MENNRRVMNAVEKYRDVRNHYTRDAWIKYLVALERLSASEYEQFADIVYNERKD